MNKSFTLDTCSNPANYLDKTLEKRLKEVMAEETFRPSALNLRFLSAYAAALSCCKSYITGEMELLMN
ncbi:MAG: hypothetical protein RBR84_01690 [Bacteroidales bacterium]|jgi:hypothetical protein|nr:hypothetical protein [Bacteroidales bacterium]MDD4087970.1 hypothetical protein [Bacteroidales bacterium]MDY0084605.1 hypothetical protein [Bacteroidales bacterium]